MWKDCETELDFLDFDYLINMLEDTANDEKLLPSSIGVYGDWGSGKSSLMYMCKNTLEQKEGTVCLMFNGWLFEGYEDAKTAMIGSILDEIEKRRKLSDEAKIILKSLYNSVDKFKLIKSGFKFGTDLFLTGGLGTVADITVKSVIAKTSDVIPGIDTEKIKENVRADISNKSLREDIKEFREKFSDLLLKSKIKKLVIFIDELDRCNPHTILDTLEAMRLFLFTGNVVFVIGADERHISYAVKTKFNDIEGIQIDIGKEYLEKLIQYPIRIPRLNSSEMEYYIMCLLFQENLFDEEFKELLNYLNEEKKKNFLQFSVDYSLVEKFDVNIANSVQECILIAKQLASVVTKGLNGNPRQCKRFLNTLDMRIRMAEYKNIQLERRILAKLMEVEYFRTPLFKKLAQLENENKLQTELTNFESKEKSALSPWKDDAWVNNWMNCEPKLTGENLILYFYFSRTSLDGKSNMVINKMSAEAMKLYEGIITGSEGLLSDAIKKICEIGDYDAGLILDGLFSDLTQESTLINPKIRSFLRWGGSKNDLHVPTIEYLKGIEGTKITAVFFPLIEEFYDVTNRNPEMKCVLEKWKSENSKLTKLINELDGEK